MGDPATDDEREIAVTLILKSGYELQNVVVWDIAHDMVQLHVLNDNGRRVYVVIDEIAVVYGGLDD